MSPLDKIKSCPTFHLIEYPVLLGNTSYYISKMGCESRFMLTLTRKDSSRRQQFFDSFDWFLTTHFSSSNCAICLAMKTQSGCNDSWGLTEVIVLISFFPYWFSEPQIAESPLKTQWSITCSSLDTPDLNLPLKAIAQPENLIKPRGGWQRSGMP